MICSMMTSKDKWTVYGIQKTNFMKYNIFIIVLLFVVISCKKSNRIEIEYQGKYKIEKVYRNDSLISSKTFDNENLIWFAKYKNGELQKGIEYYANQKNKIISELIKEPNHFLNTSYYENGKIKSKGESDYFNKNKFFLKRGGTIYYTKTGKIYEMMVFKNDTKKEYLIRHTVLDTIRNIILIDNTYNPALSYDEYNSNISHSK